MFPGELAGDVALFGAIALGSFVVGALGAILGIGGGTFLVPFLVFLTGMEPGSAVGISLFCVMGTSIGGASRALPSGQANLGLALCLEPFVGAGAVATALVAPRVPAPALLVGFALVLVALGALFAWLAIANRPWGPVSPRGDASFLDGEVEEPGGARIAYRPQNLPWLFGLVSLTGALSGLLGIGGGALNVTYLNLLARVPLRAATSTSVLTMLVTGSAAGAVYFARGQVALAWVATTLLFVVPGSRLGARLQRRLPERALRLAFSLLALVIAALTLARASSLGAP